MLTSNMLKDQLHKDRDISTTSESFSVSTMSQTGTPSRGMRSRGPTLMYKRRGCADANIHRKNRTKEACLGRNEYPMDSHRIMT